ncbi:MAG: DNA methyltransferase [Caldilineaceae bacterium]|nr:DNA methyltransferase [Caldilineaceae bacterium]
MSTSVGTPNWASKTIWTGDNLYIMRGMNSASVDLIYLDPPFNSKANYAAPIGSMAAGAAFKDTWTLTDIDVEWINLIEQKHPQLYRVLLAAMTKSDKSYLVYMAARLLEMKRLMREGGSIYLHCDSTMSHYLKAVMDAIFGRKQFQAHINWKRTFAHNDRLFSATSDHILWYCKPGRPTRNSRNVKVPFSPDELAEKYPYNDNRGRHRRDNLMGPGTTAGESGKSWRGCDPTDYGRCWSAPRTGEYAKYLNGKFLPGYLEIPGVHDRLDALDDAGFIYWTSTVYRY